MDIKRQFKPSAITVALLAALSFPSLAENGTSGTQSAETQSAEDKMTVLGKTYRNTATKNALLPEETPQGITVIDSEQLENRAVKNLNQALRYSSGVNTENRGASVGMFDSFSIRGFATKNVNYYDGLSLLFLNGWNLQPQIDPIALQQVEVFKGPTSVLYGAMPPGGMVNMIAKSPQQESQTELSLSVGSRSLQALSIDSTGQLGNSDLSYRVIALHRSQDSQVDHAEEERRLLAPSLDWQVNDRTLLSLSAYYQHDPSMGINSAMPLSVLKKSDPSVSMGDVNWSQFEREVFMLGYKINHEFNDHWTFLHNARFTDAELEQKNTYHVDDVLPTGQLVRHPYSTDESFKGYVLDNQLSGRIDLGQVEMNLLFGIDYQEMDGQSIYSAYGLLPTDRFYQFDPLNPNNQLLDPSQLIHGGTYVDDTESKQLGVYFQNQMRVNKLVLIAGARFDKYESKSVFYASESDHDHFSYRIGALYEFSIGLAPFASYATSFEPAPGISAAGKQFEPEVSQQAEVGVKYLSQDMSKEFTASLFHITKQDIVMANPLDTFGPKIQIGEGVSKGIEFEGRWFINDNLDIAAQFTQLDMEITKDSGLGLKGTTPIYVPDQMASLWANYSLFSGPLAGTRFSAGARYVGEMEMNAHNTQGKVPDYQLFDLSIGYDLAEAFDSLQGAKANIIINNLFDEEYYACYDQTNCWFGAEQTVELNVKYAF